MLHKLRPAPELFSVARAMFEDLCNHRLASAEQGPDGYLYLATEVRYGSGSPDGMVIRLEPAGG